MKTYEFIPVSEVPMRYKRTKNQEVLEAFLKTGMDMCELKMEDMKKQAASRLRASAARYSLPVLVVQHHGRVFLFRDKI